MTFKILTSFCIFTEINNLLGLGFLSLSFISMEDKIIATQNNRQNSFDNSNLFMYLAKYMFCVLTLQ